MLRGKGLTGKFRFTKWVLMALVAVLALGSIGITYASFSGREGRNKDKVVPIASCSDPFTWVVSNDDGVSDNISPYGIIDPGDNGGGTEYDFGWGSTSSDDPSGGPPPGPVAVPGTLFPRYTKDVARTLASIDEDPQYITVEIENAYPYYYPTVFFALECPLSIQGSIQGIVIDEDATTPEPDLIPELTVTYSGIYPGQPIPAGGEAAGALHILVEQSATQAPTSYKIRLSITTVCVPVTETCGTAYAYSDEYATCFIDMTDNMLKNPPWGWSNGPLTADFYEFPLYAGAGGCDISSGELAGTLTIDYDGSTAIVTYDMNEGFTMDDTHLYVGNEPLPRDKKGNYTVSPGQYPYSHDLEDAITDTYTVNVSGEIYVVAHAVTCWFSD